MLITSPQNSKIKLVNRLRGKRGRQREARFVIDYERDLQRALQLGYDIEFLELPGSSRLRRKASTRKHHELTPALFKRISYRENPDGVIAVMRSKPDRGLASLGATVVQHAIALVGLSVPGNIGALLRSSRRRRHRRSHTGRRRHRPL